MISGETRFWQRKKHTIAECVMQQHAVCLRESRGSADDVDDRNVLGEAAGDGVQRRKLTDAKGGNDGGDAFDPGIAVRSISSIKLVDIADPVEPSFREIVEGDKVVVSRNAMNTADAHLVQPTEEISFLPALASVIVTFEAITTYSATSTGEFRASAR